MMVDGMWLYSTIFFMDINQSNRTTNVMFIDSRKETPSVLKTPSYLTIEYMFVLKTSFFAMSN